MDKSIPPSLRINPWLIPVTLQVTAGKTVTEDDPRRGHMTLNGRARGPIRSVAAVEDWTAQNICSTHHVNTSISEKKKETITGLKSVTTAN